SRGGGSAAEEFRGAHCTAIDHVSAITPAHDRQALAVHPGQALDRPLGPINQVVRIRLAPAAVMPAPKFAPVSRTASVIRRQHSVTTSGKKLRGFTPIKACKPMGAAMRIDNERGRGYLSGGHCV